jgi:23S rRNA pseudouridine2605 synthase
MPNDRKKAVIRKKAVRGRGTSTQHTTTRGKVGGRKKAGRKASGAGGKVSKTRRSPRRTVESREGGVRLNKLLAEHGLASRRAADEMISDGHVTVDGVRVEELGLKVDPTQQVIEVDGAPLDPVERQGKRYYLLNKPAGVVCTNERRETRPRAVDMITDRAKGRIYTVGRLDEESKGLIILTNDGDFANRVMHPRYGVTKTYAVKLRGRIDDADVQRVRDGVRLKEGRTGPVRVLIKKRSREYSRLEVTLQEGKNREIRRIFLSVGFKVVELRRTHIGTVHDRKLKFGFWRYLERQEVEELLDLSAGVEPTETGPSARGRSNKGSRGAGARRSGGAPRGRKQR